MVLADEPRARFHPPGKLHVRLYDVEYRRAGIDVYGPTVADMFRQSAAIVDKILKGAKPGEIAVGHPKKLNLVINVKTARGLGLTMPPSLLARADRVIE